MAGYQFLHLDLFARVSPAKSKERQRNYREIISEARREPESTLHIRSPHAPKILLGSLDGIEDEIEASAASATDAAGHRLRKDAPVLAAGVISFPERSVQWPKFREASLAWLRQQYGDNLRCVLEHDDEKYPHIHFFAPVPVIDGRSRPDLVDPGILAKRAAKEAGRPGAAQQAAYCQAMREWQKDFRDSVALRFGLTHRGPGRRRLTRREWRMEQDQAEEVGRLIHEFENIQQHADHADKALAAARVELSQIRKIEEGKRKIMTEQSQNAQSQLLAQIDKLEEDLRQERMVRSSQARRLAEFQQRYGGIKALCDALVSLVRAMLSPKGKIASDIIAMPMPDGMPNQLWGLALAYIQAKRSTPHGNAPLQLQRGIGGRELG